MVGETMFVSGAAMFLSAPVFASERLKNAGRWRWSCGGPPQPRQRQPVIDKLQYFQVVTEKFCKRLTISEPNPGLPRLMINAAQGLAA